MAPIGSIQVNRAPVLTLWAAIVAERLGHDRESALTLGKAVAGLNAQAKGRRLGIFTEPAPKTKAAAERERAAAAKGSHVELLGRSIPIVRTPDGVRAVVKDRPIDPASVERSLDLKFGAALDDVRVVLRDLARAYPPKDLAQRAYALYEQFRPEILAGTRGWGAKGTLDLRRIRALATRARSA